jgi:peptide/nickel transport system substrate-binding protein
VASPLSTMAAMAPSPGSAVAYPAIAGLLAMAILATSCTLLPQAPNPPAVKPGGTLTVGTWQPPATLLAAGISDQSRTALAVVAPMAEGLLRVRDQSELRAGGPGSVFAPQLALEVPTLENGDVVLAGGGMTVTWKLRHGVRWQDGADFSSSDVVDTFQFWWLKYRDRNPTLLPSTSGWDQVTDVQALDTYTVAVSFSHPFGPYLQLGSGPYGILPGHLLEKTWDAGGDLTRVKLPVALPGAYSGVGTWDDWIVGTGPYMLKEFEPDDHLTMVRNPHWWGPHAPYLDSIVFKFESSLSVELADLRGGTIQLALDAGGADAVALKDALSGSHGTAVTARSTGVEHLDFNLKNRFLANPAIRSAIRLALDRKAFLPPAAAGKPAAPPDAWICTGLAAWCADPSVGSTGADPKAANALLDKAGFALAAAGDGAGYRSFSDGTTISLSLTSIKDDAVRLHEEDLIAAALQAIGIKVQAPYRNVPARRLFAGYQVEGVLSTHAFDLALYSDSVGWGDPDGFYSEFVCSQVPSAANGGAGQNATQLCDPAVDAGFNSGQGAVAAGDRKKAYGAVQRALTADVPNVPLRQLIVVQLASSKAGGIAANGDVWTSNAADWFRVG